jgi:hypothetical protein
MQGIVTVPTFIRPHRKVLFPVSKHDSSGNKTRCLQKNHGFLSYLILKRCLPHQPFISNDNNVGYVVFIPFVHYKQLNNSNITSGVTLPRTG